MKQARTTLRSVIQSLGIVFGDIGTSPLYTLPVVFAVIPPTYANILGVLSLVLWTLTLLITVQYAWLAMSLSKRGQGGTIVLREIVTPLFKSSRVRALLATLACVGIAFLMGDGVITPAISLVSSVEGLKLIPVLHWVTIGQRVTIACALCTVLFLFQSKGTGTVSRAFGPCMVLWFTALALSGIYTLAQAPQILYAINPVYIFYFLKTHKFIGFLILSKVILCATGGEALYVDMGHLSRNAIIAAWGVAWISLTLNYAGQCAFLLINPAAQNILCEIVYTAVPVPVYFGFLVLSILSTIIASQAMISGIFAIIYQGITTRLLPRFTVIYTSKEQRSQIYIPLINRILYILVILVIINFRQSSILARMYGLTASGTMLVTALFITLIFWRTKKYFKATIGIILCCINTIFFTSALFKISDGAYWSLIIATVPLIIMLIYQAGQRRLYRILTPTLHDTFVTQFSHAYDRMTHIQGTAIFLTKAPNRLPSYITHTIVQNKIVYEQTVILSVVTTDEPFGIETHYTEPPISGLRFCTIRVGYMEHLDIMTCLHHIHIYPTVIFYGIEEFTSDNIIGTVYAFLKNITPSFVQFYNLPAHKLHGVVMQARV